MLNLFKYRKLAILLLIILIISYLFTFIAFWNIILKNQIQNEVWLMIFFTFTFLTGLCFFLLTHKLTDQNKINSYLEYAISKEKAPDIRKVREEAQITEKNGKKYEQLSSELAHRLDKVKDTGTFCNLMLKVLAEQVLLVKGIMYIKERRDNFFYPAGYYAFSGEEPEAFTEGEGIAGQTIADRKPIRICDIPQDYIVTSGLGNSQPRNIIFYPLLINDEPVALLELGFFDKPGRETDEFLAQFSAEAVKLLNNILSRLS